MEGDAVTLRYWEFEDAPFKEKMKDPSVKEIARIYFDNETKAYRFARALYEVKSKGQLRLKDCAVDLPVATWKRYLDFGVNVGILKHEASAYSFTDRYTKPLRNLSVYIKTWADARKDENLEMLFATAKTAKQQKRGGRVRKEQLDLPPQADATTAKITPGQEAAAD